MASCSYGKPSLTFPLSIPAATALALLEASGSQPVATADVTGHGTFKTRAAGAESVRLHVRIAEALATDHSFCRPEPGAHLVALRPQGQEQWLLGLAGTQAGQEADCPSLATEVVVLARPDKACSRFTYLPERTLRSLFPVASGDSPGTCGFRFLRYLKPTQRDCPEQWLRDRLLKLADMVEESVPVQQAPALSGARVRAALAGAGLAIDERSPEAVVFPADFAEEGEGDAEAVPSGKHPSRISEEELGYWNEEMRLGNRCAGSMDGAQRRLDYLMGHLPA
eukprot:TRINITY_DN30158_c1_g3_i7.p1 TRINITY_DN30158_c1_g3~~TRINITY_DN30158_c1_g3_i7.p1  ORF type:complete len:281 (-),score=48.87 TRINITY_DN30158_c1_g3_i7:115-957(-)